MKVKRLKESREILNLKQKEIAEIFNLNYSTISGWETGKDTIPLERLIDYANHYNLSLDYLFGLRNNNKIKYLPITIDLKLIAKNLRILRLKNKFTQKQVAKLLNTSQGAYSHYEQAIYLIPTHFYII